MPGKINSQRRQVSYCYDESLPPIIGEALKAVGFPMVIADKGTSDEDLIPKMGRCNQTWITKDDRSKTEHESLLSDANISVVWVRGLTHGKGKKKSSLPHDANLKDILRMLVNKLDRITAQIAEARGPRYFLLYTNISKANQDKIATFTALREVRENLAGLPRRKHGQGNRKRG